MVSLEEAVKKVASLFATISKKVYEEPYHLPGGGKNLSIVKNGLMLLEKEYGSLTEERIADYCIAMIHYRYKDGDTKFPTLNLIFGKTSLERYLDFKAGKKYFEDMWLNDYGLSKSSLLSSISDCKEHPLSKYIYIESEEVTKKRSVANKFGVIFCNRTTTLFTPFSATCESCFDKEKCKRMTQEAYPELYRLRIEQWENQRK